MTILIGDTRITADDLRTAVRRIRDTAGHFDVWSNALYLLPIVAARDGYTAVVLGLAGLCLAFGSAWYHATHGRAEQRADEWGMMCWLSAIAAVCVASAVHQPALALACIPVWEVYRRVLHRTDSFWHVGLWAAVTLGVLAYDAGWAALVPTGGLAAAVLIRFVPTKTAHGTRHAWWHVAGAVAGAAAVALSVA